MLACRFATCTAGLVHAVVTWLHSYEAVERAITAKELGFPKQTDGNQIMKVQRARAVLAIRIAQSSLCYPQALRHIASKMVAAMLIPVCLQAYARRRTSGLS